MNRLDGRLGRIERRVDIRADDEPRLRLPDGEGGYVEGPPGCRTLLDVYILSVALFERKGGLDNNEI